MTLLSRCPQFKPIIAQKDKLAKSSHARARLNVREAFSNFLSLSKERVRERS